MRAAGSGAVSASRISSQRGASRSSIQLAGQSQGPSVHLRRPAFMLASLTSFHSSALVMASR
ncbi:MAG: hypothetical protein D6766_11220 [Verrucomicrobia bacterium]|nr:MAG: hypothetical protein D6766_11220 [Verrucomicrobiota bacterium]